VDVRACSTEKLGGWDVVMPKSDGERVVKVCGFFLLLMMVMGEGYAREKENRGSGERWKKKGGG
jgi:hypothetical protein